MIFFALLIAIVLDYSFPFPYAQRAQPLIDKWHGVVAVWTEDAPDWLVWALRVGTPALAAALTYWLILWIAEPFAWVWLTAVLYVCAGYGDFKDQMSPVGLFGRVIAAVEAGGGEFNAKAAIQYAWRRVAGVWLAFLMLAIVGFGPAGAVLFRLATPSSDPDKPSSPFSLKAWHYITWIPARAMILGCGMVGAFDGAIGAWRQPAGEDVSSEDNEALILEGVMGSFGDSAVVTPGMTERLLTRFLRLLLGAVLLATLIL